MRTHRRLLLPLLVACVLLVAGCSLRATDIPIPGTYLSGPKYQIHIQFQSVLNLPDKAKVIADGVDVGMLDHIELVGNLAVATVNLRRSVQLPVGTTAELQQSTILGDIYIALAPPQQQPSGAPVTFLRDGGTIPVSDTLPATNVEDILRALSDVVTGGRIEQLQQVVDSVNAAFPTDPQELTRIVTAGEAALHDMSADTVSIDQILSGAAGISTDLEQHRDGVDSTLTYGPARAAGLSDVLLGVVRLLLDSRGLAQNVGDLALPLIGDLHSILDTLAPELRTLSTLDITLDQNSAAFDQLLRDKLIPFFSAPPNVRIQTGSPQAVVANATTRSNELIEVLHSIGMAR